MALFYLYLQLMKRLSFENCLFVFEFGEMSFVSFRLIPKLAKEICCSDVL